MTQHEQDRGRFTIGAAVALVVGAGLAVAVALSLALPARWALAAWALTGAIGLWQGLRTQRLHGTPGPAMIKTLAIGLVGRGLVVVGIGALALTGSRDAAFAAMAGLVGGFLPLFVFESQWFLKRSAVTRGPSEA